MGEFDFNEVVDYIINGCMYLLVFMAVLIIVKFVYDYRSNIEETVKNFFH